jgi:hypothetical protein
LSIDLVLLLYLGYLVFQDKISIEIPLLLGLISIVIGIISYKIAKDNLHAFYLRITNDIDNDLVKIRTITRQYNESTQLLLNNHNQPIELRLLQVISNANRLRSVRRGLVWRVHKFVKQAMTVKFWINNRGERTKVANQLIRLIDELLIWDENSHARVINGEAGNVAGSILKVLDFNVNKDKLKKLIQLFEKHIAERRDDETDNKTFINNVLDDFSPIHNEDNNPNLFKKLTIERREELIRLKQEMERNRN